VLCEWIFHGFFFFVPLSHFACAKTFGGSLRFVNFFERDMCIKIVLFDIVIPFQLCLSEWSFFTRANVAPPVVVSESD
jgi:hypothetical protein